MDNLSTVDKLPGPSVSLIQRFHCSLHVDQYISVSPCKIHVYFSFMRLYIHIHILYYGHKYIHVTHPVVHMHAHNILYLHNWVVSGSIPEQYMYASCEDLERERERVPAQLGY